MVLAGCEEAYKAPKQVMMLSFELNKPLKYRFVSSREVSLSLSDQREKAPKKMSERLEMTIVYTPIDVDAYGDYTIKAVCESSHVTRSSFSSSRASGKDVMDSLQGMEWQFKVNALGQIRDYSGLTAVVEQLGKKTIKIQAKRNVKDQDMIWDFVNSQWFIWDPVSSQANAGIDIVPGSSWTSTQIIPFARLVPAERRITYTDLGSQDGADKIGIGGDIEMLPMQFNEDKKPMPTVDNLPKPYQVKFQMRGMFGFLIRYKVLSLEGSSTAVYDSERALLLSNKQEYDMNMTASFMLPLGNSVPQLAVHQSITTELIE